MELDLNTIHAGPGDSEFFSQAFDHISQIRKQNYSTVGDNIQRVCVEEYGELSKRLDRSWVQDSCAVRNVLKTRRLANLLINDKGELLSSLIPRAIKHLKQFLYPLGPDREHDARRQEHILNVLQLLEKKEFASIIKTITKPYSHKHAEQLIRETLQLAPSTVISDAHARRAVLSAWMCYLRQSVGSCFATAPAILVHDEQPTLFLNDLRELMNTGRLKRTFNGIEYSAPLSTSWGAGDLKKPFYLSKTLQEGAQPAIWFSPGLIAALEAINYIDSEAALKAKIIETKHILLHALGTLEHVDSIFITNFEDIFKYIILDKLQITEEDLQNYENRNSGVLQTGLMVQVSNTTTSGKKFEACSRYYTLKDIAENAFKALADNALLKSWEFTVASFAETKPSFSRWNLYSSLGLGPQEPSGIGERIYAILKDKLDRTNERVRELQTEYELVYGQLKFLEGRMRNATTEKEIQWMKIEYQSKLGEFNTFEEIRNSVHAKAGIYANMFNELMEIYDQLFPQYFQEVYDADMHDVSSGPYDDSPAGFRLMYKHGRDNTSLWTFIRNQHEYIDALASFFISTEPQISSIDRFAPIKDDFTQIVTAIVMHIRTREFLESSFYRMAKAHNTPIVKNPLENLDKVDKKPWVYTSGGSMSSLVSSYFSYDEKPTDVSRWVENPMELLVFLADSLKQQPKPLMNEFSENEEKSMLMHSPTHAFLLKPGRSLFKEAWQSDAFTYTWIRDRLVTPVERFVYNIELDRDMMKYILGEMQKKIPAHYVSEFQKLFTYFYQTMRPGEFRNHVLDTIKKQKNLRYAGRSVLEKDEMDSYLYSSLPMIHLNDLPKKVSEFISLLKDLDDPTKNKMLEIFETIRYKQSKTAIVSAINFQNIIKALFCFATQQTAVPFNLNKYITDIAQANGFAMPKPIIFADTNWVKDEFAFTYNPGSSKLEFWRMDHLGSCGTPMTIWAQWLNGSRQDIPWGIYPKVKEYTAIIRQKIPEMAMLKIIR